MESLSSIKRNRLCWSILGLPIVALSRYKLLKLQPLAATKRPISIGVVVIPNLSR